MLCIDRLADRQTSMALQDLLLQKLVNRELVPLIAVYIGRLADRQTSMALQNLLVFTVLLLSLGQSTSSQASMVH